MVMKLERLPYTKNKSKMGKKELCPCKIAISLQPDGILHFKLYHYLKY